MRKDFFYRCALAFRSAALVFFFFSLALLCTAAVHGMQGYLIGYELPAAGRCLLACLACWFIAGVNIGIYNVLVELKK